jgi:hypothetical protein
MQALWENPGIWVPEIFLKNGLYKINNFIPKWDTASFWWLALLTTS